MRSAESLFRILQQMPMVAAAACLVAGIAVFDDSGIPPIVFSAGFSVLVAAAYLRRGRGGASACLSAAVFLLGGASVTFRAHESAIPAGERMFMEVEIADIPAIRGETGTVAARIRTFEREGTIMQADEKAVVKFRVPLSLSFGDRVECWAVLTPFTGRFGWYDERMMNVGYAGTLFLDSGNVLKATSGFARNSLHATALRRLLRLPLSGDAAAVVAAMGAGERSAMTPQMKSDYARSGISHILAVSGLHTGIVFMLMYFLFGWTAVFRRGPELRCLLASAAVWLYVAMCGWPPSAVRSAVMVTVVLLSRMSTSRYAGINSLAAAAMVMMALDPSIAGDTGFRLSFVAVAALVTAGAPLFTAARRRGTAARIAWSTLLVGTITSVATAPLTAYIFGAIPVAGIAATPPVIVCTYITVILSMLWIMFPVPFLAGVYGFLLQHTADAQNAVAAFFASREWAVADCELSGWKTLAIYGAAAAAWLAASALTRKTAAERTPPTTEKTPER